MKQLAYIELDTHAEIAANFRELIRDSEEFQVDFYFSSKILALTGAVPGGNILECNAANLLSLLADKRYQLVIIGTAHRYFSTFLKIAEKFRTATVIHNQNFAKVGRLQLLLAVFKADFKYRLKLLLKEGLLVLPEFHRRVKQIALDKSVLKENQVLLPLFYNCFKATTADSRLKIVIPGTVSQKRRDYRQVIEILKNAGTDRSFEIVFLGKAQDPELNELKQLQITANGRYKVKFYCQKVSQDIFDHEMKTATVLWCPLQPETAFFSQKEIYGVTKISGNVGDAVKYGKTAIFPGFYRSSCPFIVTEKADVLSQILELQNIGDFSSFTQEKVSLQLHETLRSLIQKA